MRNFIKRYMNKYALLISILIFVIITLYLKINNNEPFTKNSDNHTFNLLIKAIDDAINERIRANGTKSRYDDDIFQSQIVKLTNAKKYAEYINNNIL